MAEDGSISLIDNDVSLVYTSAGKDRKKPANCSCDSLFVPTTQKYAIARLGNGYIHKSNITLRNGTVYKAKPNTFHTATVMFDYR